MSKVTMIGCDVHDASLVLQAAVGQETAVKKKFGGSEVAEMIAWLKEFALRRESSRIVLAYEASSRGFGLYDQLTEAGIECYVLAPTHLPRSTHRQKNKTDDKDADLLLNEVRAFVLAGRPLPQVWVPDLKTRDDREVVRLRLQLGEQRTSIKNQIRHLAKRNSLAFPDWFTKSGEWSRRSLQWLNEVAAGAGNSLPEGARVALSSLIDLYRALTCELKEMDQAIRRLARSERYARAFRKLKLMSGVGTLTAMVFLSELGDLARFANRRQLAAYLGLAPSAHESGTQNDRKGHITRQGSARVRHVLCQAAWAAMRCSKEYKATYEKIRRGTPKRTKVAIVALMRRLAIAMWHTVLSPEMEALLDEIDRDQAAAKRSRKQKRSSSQSETKGPDRNGSAAPAELERDLWGTSPPDPLGFVALKPRSKRGRGSNDHPPVRPRPGAGAQVASQQSPILPSG
jgi:transposase